MKDSKEKESDIKLFSVRIKKDLWKHVKRLSVSKEKSMNGVLSDLIEEDKNKFKKMVDTQI